MKQRRMINSMLIATIVSFVLITGCVCKNQTPVISEIQTHIMVPGSSHTGLWLGSGLFCEPSEQPNNFHIFFSETDRKGGDSMQKLLYYTVDSFPENEDSISLWKEKWVEQPYPEELKPRIDESGYEWVPTFNWKYHKKSGNWLGIGHLLRQKDKRLSDHAEHLAITYSVYNSSTKTFSEWKSFQIKVEGNEKPSVAYGQRVDLENGDILVPFRVLRDYIGKNSLGWCGAAHCKFDGNELKLSRISNLFTNQVPRGLSEPSMAFYNNKYYMTLRAQDGFSHITTSSDGMVWDEPQPWKWDDGTSIAMNQTMTKFIAHSEALYLVYCRITPDNINVMRNRAPLFIALVDSERKCLVQDSEQIIFPNRGLPIGNFSIRNVSPLESWVTVSEWDRTGKDIQCDVLLGRIIWSKSNKNLFK